MTWKTEYPTISTVKRASLQTLNTWSDNLPAPQSDVERTVRRRIEKRLFESAAKECREKAPDIADKWNELVDKMGKMGIKTAGRM